jgi:hypothetical protein
MNLSSAGAFAPLLTHDVAPPLPVTYVPIEEPAPRRRAPRVIGAACAVAILLGTSAFVAMGSKPAAQASPPRGEEPDLPSAAMTGSATASTEAPESPPAPTAAAATRVPTVANVPPAIRSAARANERASAATNVASPPSPTTIPASPPTEKCCAGETEMACHMRLSTGASCAAAAPAATAAAAPPFDRAAAMRALSMNVTACRRAEGPVGAGHVRVTFLPIGSVSAVDVGPPYAGTATGACVAQRYRAATIPAFAGSALTVGKTFTVE